MHINKRGAAVGTFTVLGAAALATLGGIQGTCHKYPDNTKAVAETNADAGSKLFNVYCPKLLADNGDVYGGVNVVAREKEGHISNGTAFNPKGQLIGLSKGDDIYLTLPGTDLERVNEYANATQNGENPDPTAFGIRKRARVDVNQDVWEFKDIYTGGGKGRSREYSHSELVKIGHLDKKSDKLSTKDQNALGLYLLA